MKLWILASALCFLPAAPAQTETTAREILALERKAMEGWQKGDPDAALASAAPEITYFHVVTGKRLDGLPAVKALFDSYRGRPLFDSYEIADPQVQCGGDFAVLTYILVRHVSDATTRWNATQVYQRKKDGWRVIHTHWSANTQ